MAPLPWYFDVISPFSYLQLEWLLRDWPEVALQPHPVVLGAILAKHGQRGPAEIDGKREFTYRYVLWRAAELGIPLRFPPQHPFNPLAALRLIVAAGASVPVVQAVFRHIWMFGGSVQSSADLQPLATQFGIVDVMSAIGTSEVKAALRDNTEAALAKGVFGVPTLSVFEQLFFGQDATAFAMAVLEDPQLLQTGEYARLADIPVGVRRA